MSSVPKQRYYRIDLAARQLETAVWLFLEGQDRFSVITLAGAASGTLTQLLLNAGKQPFADYGRLVIKELVGIHPSREKYNRKLNQLLGVDALKHHGAHDAPTIELDENEAAERAILRALIDFMELRGADLPFVKAFLNWMWERDGVALQKWHEALPAKIKALRLKK